jgi:hypothetical protein
MEEIDMNGYQMTNPDIKVTYKGFVRPEIIT